VEGKTLVLTPSTEGPTVVAENELQIDGRLYGTAAVDGAPLLRTDRELMKIGK
jgi:hypothetical protein